MIKPPWQARSAVFHPHAAHDMNELPDGLRGAVAAALPPGRPALYIFGVPADYQSSGLLGLRRTSEQAVVFHPDGATVILAGSKENVVPAAVYLPHDHVLYVRTSLLLLQGRLEIGAAMDGAFVWPSIEFNTVGWALLEDALKAFTCRTADAHYLPRRSSTLHAETGAVDLNTLPYKFAAGLRHYGHLPGDALLGVIFQPATWRRRWGVVQDQVSPNTLLALTDDFVILIEEQRALSRKSGDYGWIITHIPRVALANVAIQTEGQHHRLILQLARSGAETERRVTVEAPAINRLRDLWMDASLPLAGEEIGQTERD